MEACLATVIIGVGVTASMTLFATVSKQNRAASDMTTAMHLAQNLQETMAGLSLCDPAFGSTYFRLEPGQDPADLDKYDDVDDWDRFDSRNPLLGLGGPIDSTRQALPSLAQYSQVVSVWPLDVSDGVSQHNLSINTNPTAPDRPQTQYTGAARVTVRIMYRQTPDDPDSEIYRSSWIRVAE
jgi:hypothetical protein